MHDVLDPRDLVPDEARQLIESGYPVGDLHRQAIDASAAGDLDRLEALEAALAGTERDSGWPWDEPADETVLSTLVDRAVRVPVDAATLEDRVHGAWLGRAAGNTLGKPVEGLTRAEVERYLRAADQWPLQGYLPLLEPLPEGVTRLHPSAPVATAGRFVEVPRDDDLDWTILNLHLLEQHGAELTSDRILAGWLDRLPFTQTYTAERAAYRNAILGLRPPETATRRNPYREWIGALIRGDVFGYVHPGDPAAAARLALIDARISHVANGMYGELWAAGLVAAAFATDRAAVAVRRSLDVVPPGSRLAHVIRTMLELHRNGVDRTGALDHIDQAWGDLSWVHTLNNAAAIVAALLWGTDFLDTCGIAVAAGRDTDSSTATVGSVVGALHGADAIPPALAGGTPRRIRSAVRDFDRITVEELVARTLRVAGRLGGSSASS